MLIEFENAFNCLEDVLDLHVKDDQRNTIETVEECIQEARELSLWKPTLIKLDKENVGFAMYGMWKEEGEHGRVWLDRFFIDERYQGRGYAKEVLPILIDKIMNTYLVSEIYLSVYESNLPAIQLYKKNGFEFNGEKDINSELVMVKKVFEK